MSEAVWYLFQEGNQQGPMTLEALRALADQGKLKSDGLVTRMGMSDWLPARSVPELFPQEATMRPPLPPGVGPRRDLLELGRGLGDRLRRTVGADDVVQTLPHLRAVARLLEILRRGLTEDGLARADRIARQVGHLAFIAAAVLLALAFMLLGVRANSFSLFFTGLLIVAPAAVVLHFLAVLFLDAAPALLRKSPSELSSPAVTVFFALAFLAAAVYCFLMGLYGLLQGGSLLVFGLWMGSFAVLVYACGMALNSQTLNVLTGADLTAGEEALGIAMFLVKLPVRLIPFLFGVGSAVGVCAAVYLFYLLFSEAPYLLGDVAQRITRSVLSVALLPFLAYLEFALSFLLVEVLRAILRTPGRIEALRRDVNGR